MLCKKNIKYVAKIYSIAGILITRANAENIQVELSSNNSTVIINDENAYYGNIAAGTSLFNLDDVFKIIKEAEQNG